MSITTKFLEYLKILSNKDFKAACSSVESFVSAQNKDDLINLVRLIGTIPENIQPSSSEEKLFAKAGDIISARALEFLNLKAKSLDERGDSGDFIATSTYHRYSLIGDAKSFRFSRTAKNQKDFKVKALSQWREDNDYAVLIAPLFQYPTNHSQIYSDSLTENVLLFSWEHLLILLKLGITETNNKTFEQLWNFPQKYSKKVSISDRKDNYFKEFNKYFIEEFNLTHKQLKSLLSEEILSITDRAEQEKKYWELQQDKIKNYTKEEAITELLKLNNIGSKIAVITNYVGGLENVKTKYVD